MIGLFVAAALVSAPSECAATASSEAALVETKRLPSHDSASRAGTLFATTYKTPGLGPGNIADTRLVIKSERCERLFEQEFGSTQDIKLALVHLAKTPFLVVSVFKAGGSGCGIDHMLIRYDGTPRAWAPAALGHDNMGSLFVGDLGQGRGPGLVLLEAQWGSGSHYDPHPYRVSIYRWRGEHFIGPETKTTTAMSPDPYKVAKSLGLPSSAEFSFPC